MMRSVRRLRFAAYACAKRAVFAFYRLGCERCNISGLIFYLPVHDRDALAQFKANAQNAVEILQEFDPIRLKRIRRDLSNGIVAAPGGNTALYHRDIGVCVLNTSRLLDSNYVRAVLSIVHEATHARMRHLSNATPERAARMERICIGAEIAFVSRLPANGPALEALRQMQAEITPSSFDDRKASDAG